MEPLKNLFSPELVGWVARHLARRVPRLDAEIFAAPILAALPALELKERAQLIANHMVRALPADAPTRHGMLVAMLHPDPLDHADKSSDANGLAGWAVMPLTLAVGRHGLEDFDGALAALKEMTKRFTAEFAIRHMLLSDQRRALDAMASWVSDPNRHVRRLVSEGTRPRLPWAMQLPALVADPRPVLPLLEALRDDPEPYVRRSVANHLNDISKDHAALFADIVESWMQGASADRRALLKHASRSLIKKGDERILATFGRLPARLDLGSVELSAATIKMPGVLRFTVALTSTADVPQNLTVDYVVHFRKANGAVAPKVFKGGELSLAPGKTRIFGRSHRFAEITTRRHYGGLHRLGLRINGVDTDTVEFELVT